MKKGFIIVLIIILSLIALSLTSLLVFCIQNEGNIGGIFTMQTVSHSSPVQKEESFDLSEINNIHFNLTSSDIHFYLSDNDKLIIRQKGNATIKEEYLFTSNVSNSNLHITAGDKHHGFHFFGFFTPNCLYEVYLPKDYAESILLNTTSSDVTFDTAVALKKLEVTTVSGDIEILQNLEVLDLSLKSISGDIDFSEITSEKVNLSTTSGEITGEALKSKKDFTILSVSGEIDMNLVEGYGTLKTTSGDIAIEDFRITGDTKLTSTSGNITMSHMIGNYTLETKTVSGNVSNHTNNNSSKDTESYYLEIKTTSGNIRVSQ